MKKLDHIGIAVKDLEQAEDLYQKLLGIIPNKQEYVVDQNVKISFFEQQDSPSIELIEATNENSEIAQFITKNGEGIHHVAFEVDDVEAEIERLTQEGFKIVGSPKIGSRNKIIAFVHPKTTNGVLIELCQHIK